jgi:hypothetical protein
MLLAHDDQGASLEAPGAFTALIDDERLPIAEMMGIETLPHPVSDLSTTKEVVGIG